MASYLAYFRILGYITTLVMHISNLVYMRSCFTEEALKDPMVSAFGQLQNRFFTCWNFFLQITYAALGLYCDISTLRNSDNKKYRVPYKLDERRKVMLSAILWPSTWLVFSVFWPLYIWDRRLILPEFTDKVLTNASNHIIHTAIIPVVLWELLFTPRKAPESHVKNIFHLVMYMLTYLSVLIYTYYDKQIWLYPMFKMAYGSVVFPVIILVIGVALLFFYFMQWRLTALVYGKQEAGAKKAAKKSSKIR